MLVACVGFVRPAMGQRTPALDLTVRLDSVVVSELTVRDLFSDDRFPDAMESGFPLYLAFRVELRQSRSLWDRTATAVEWERIVLWDPVRERYVIEDAEGTEIVGSLTALERRVGGPWPVQLPAEGAGPHYVKAVLNARTLSDEDVDEVFAWLKGEAVDTPQRERPGFITRTARRLLVQVAPLPATTVETRSAELILP